MVDPDGSGVERLITPFFRANFVMINLVECRCGLRLDFFPDVDGRFC